MKTEMTRLRKQARVYKAAVDALREVLAAQAACVTNRGYAPLGALAQANERLKAAMRAVDQMEGR